MKDNIIKENKVENKIKKEKNEKLKRIVIITIKAILVVIWMIVVFRFSAENGAKSKNTSQTAFKEAVKSFDPSIVQESSAQKVEDYQPLIRKMAHFFLYTVGGILIYNLIYEIVDKKYKNKYIIYTIIIGALYATSDEIHQYFVPGRSSQVRDVLLDTTGIIFGALICIGVYKLIEKKSKKINYLQIM